MCDVGFFRYANRTGGSASKMLYGKLRDYLHDAISLSVLMTFGLHYVLVIRDNDAARVRSES